MLIVTIELKLVQQYIHKHEKEIQMGSKCSKDKSKQTQKPSNPTQYERKSSASYKQNSFDHAYMQIVHIEEMLSRNPDDMNLNLLMAMSLYKKGRVAESEPYFKQVLSTDLPLTAEHLMAIAELHLHKKEYQQSLKFFELTLQSEANNSQAHHRLFQVYQAMGDPRNSLQHLKKAVELDPKNSEFLNDLGLFYFNSHNLEKAEKWFKQAIQANPSSHRSHNNLGNAYRKLGKPLDAISHYSLAIEHAFKRKFPIALLNLATTYFDLGDTLKALEYFQEALQVGNNIHKLMVSKGYHLLLKTSFIKKGIEEFVAENWDEALELFNRALENDQKNPALYYYLGGCMMHKKKQKKAEQCFRKVIEYGEHQLHSEKHFVQHFVKQARLQLGENFYETRKLEKILIDDSLVESVLPSDYSFVENQE